MSVQPPNAPEYIESVWPFPASRISFRCYTKVTLASWLNQFNLFVPFHPDKVGGVNWETNFSGEYWEAEYPDTKYEDALPFPKRVTLYIDGNSSGKTVVESDESMIPGYIFKFRSYPILFPGKHVATVVIVTKAGFTLEYEWHFTVTWP